MTKKPPVVHSRTVAIIPGPAVDPYLRNIDFPQGSEMLDPEARARMAARRLAHHNERVAAAERELAAQRQRDDLRGSHRSGRREGVPNNKTVEVQALIKRIIKRYPNGRTSKHIRNRAEKTVAGRKLLKGMAASTWARHVAKILVLDALNPWSMLNSSTQIPILSSSANATRRRPIALTERSSL